MFFVPLSRRAAWMRAFDHSIDGLLSSNTGPAASPRTPALDSPNRTKHHQSRWTDQERSSAKPIAIN